MYHDFELKMIKKNPQLGLISVHDGICDLTPLLTLNLSMEELENYIGWIEQLLDKSEDYLLEPSRISLYFHDIYLDHVGDIKLKYLELGNINHVAIDDISIYHKGLANIAPEKKHQLNLAFLYLKCKEHVKVMVWGLCFIVCVYLNAKVAFLYGLVTFVAISVFKLKRAKVFGNNTVIICDKKAHLKGIGSIQDVHGLVNRVIIGRSKKCDISIEDPHVGKRHVEIHNGKEGYTIRDLNSKNGTFVNGKRIEKGDKKRLKNGDIIKIGLYEFEFIY